MTNVIAIHWCSCSASCFQAVCSTVANSNCKVMLLKAFFFPWCHILVTRSNKDDKFREKRVNLAVAKTKAVGSIQMYSSGRTFDSDAVPLRVGLVVFVSLVFNHSVAANANVWPGHLHPIQCDPATHKDTDILSIRERKEKRHAVTEGKGEEQIRGGRLLGNLVFLRMQGYLFNKLFFCWIWIHWIPWDINSKTNESYLWQWGHICQFYHNIHSSTFQFIYLFSVFRLEWDSHTPVELSLS